MVGSFGDFIHLFIPVSKEERASFFDSIVKENFIRLLFISAIYLIFEVKRFFFAPPLEMGFLKNLSDFILVFQLLMMVFALWQVIKKKAINGFLAQVIISLYCITIMFWAVNVGLTNVTKSGSVAMYILTLTVTSAMFFRRPVVTILTNIGFYLYFYYFLFHGKMFQMPRPNPMRPLDATNMYASDVLLITIIACLLAFIITRLRLRVFREHALLLDISKKDAMKDVLNHASICHALDAETQRSKRYGTPMSLLIVDIDKFKDINDQYGHQFGDEVIIKVAALIKDSIRETDYVGRYGGDEFLVIMTETQEKNAFELAERLRLAVENYNFGVDKSVTISCGLMHYKENTEDKILNLADKALYKSKADGRNKVTICN